jgi:hypothetical protein
MMKQTKVYEVQKSLPYFKEEESLPRRKANDSIWETVPWFVDI